MPKRVERLPSGSEWIFEPKWDGFRAPRRAVLDGEIVIVHNQGLDFELLQLRLHPAARA
ncbi:MAG TPA: hypothetical protein VKV17_22690 [Bryobacteraceae bacterium]|nr:hypothetical protein [Bryobacteraceae bacterium]